MSSDNPTLSEVGEENIKGYMRRKNGVKTIKANPSNTVGLVKFYNPKENFIMEISPLLLKQWADMVFDEFTFESVVYLSVHKSEDPMTTARCLSASKEYGDETQVSVCGPDNDDVIKPGGRG